MSKQQPRVSRRKFLRQVQADVAKIQADALTAQMIAEALTWYHEHKGEEVTKIVRMFLDWKEAGSPVLETPLAAPQIATV